MSMLTLYHFTSLANLPSILAAGVIEVSDKGTTGRHEHCEPNVVWLTTNADLAAGGGLLKGSHDKVGVRFTVAVPANEVSEWQAWARGNGAPAHVMHTFTPFARSWRVIERAIWSDEWVDVRNMRTGEPIPL